MAKKDTEQVLKHHMNCLAAGDLEGVMEDYDDDSILITFMGVNKGKKAIKDTFKMIIGMMTPEIVANMGKSLKQECAGEYAMITYTAPPLLIYGTDTFHIHDGKIMAQTAASQTKT